MSVRGRSRWILGGIAAVAAAVLLVVLLTGGDDETESLDAALKYLPPDAAVVVAVETDLGDEQFDELAQTVGSESFGGSELPELPGGGPFGASGLEASVSALLLAEGINYEADVEPALGGELVAGFADPPPLDEGFGADPTVAALQVENADVARDLLEEQAGAAKMGDYEGAELFGADGDGSGGRFAIDGDVVIYAASEEEVREAIDRARGKDHATAAGFEGALEGTPDDALVRVAAEPVRFLELPELAALEEMPWVAALESAGAAVSFEGGGIEVDAEVATDPEGLTPEELPLPEGEGEPALVQRRGEVASGSIDQSYTTSFLVRAAGLVLADSRFVRDVKAIERDLGIDFEEEVLRQFKGPSSSTVTFEGRFAARSTVADPAAMRALLPRLAPRLPELVRDLDSLGTEGLLALLFVAPDAPVATTPTGAESVEPVAGEAEELLFTIRGPQGPRGLEPVVELPRRIVFGMVGDTFVVASSRAEAREIATAEAEPVDGLEGASVLRAEPPRIRGVFFVPGFDEGRVEEVEASVDASLEGLSAEASIRYRD